MIEIPIEVSDAETIVRGIFHPFHLNGTKLKWHAFRPPPTRADVSVARHDYLGTDQCRTRAKSVRSPGEYRGLASLKVQAVRAAGPDVVDSREQYLGHADIMHVYILEAGEPPESKVFGELRDTCKQLAKEATFRPDPEPAAETWKGEPI